MDRFDIWMLPVAAFISGGNLATGHILEMMVIGLIAVGGLISVAYDLCRLSDKPL